MSVMNTGCPSGGRIAAARRGMRVAARARTSALIALAVVASGPVSAWGAPREEPTRRLIRPGAIVLPDGTLATDRVVAVENGRVTAIHEAGAHPAAVAGAEWIIDDWPGAVLSPGLIDTLSELGVQGRADERASSIDASTRVADAFDPFDPALLDAVRGGVTAALIRPADTLLIGGCCAVIRTQTARGAGEIMEHDGPLLVTLGPSALAFDRAPSSRAGAISMLREAIAAGQANGRAAGTADPLAEALRGDRTLLVHIASSEDLDAALILFGSGTPRLVLSVGAGVRGSVLVEELEGGSTIPLILPIPADTDSIERLTLARQMERAGLPFTFGGGLPSKRPDAIRAGAMRAVRSGLDPAAARRAMTRDAARTLGVDARLGSIAPGLDADLVVFSGDPLHPASRVLAVYVRGERLAGVEARPAVPDRPRRRPARNGGPETLDDGESGGGA